jgi:hypothetical protein
VRAGGQGHLHRGGGFGRGDVSDKRVDISLDDVIDGYIIKVFFSASFSLVVSTICHGATNFFGFLAVPGLNISSLGPIIALAVFIFYILYTGHYTKHSLLPEFFQDRRYIAISLVFLVSFIGISIFTESLQYLIPENNSYKCELTYGEQFCGSIDLNHTSREKFSLFVQNTIYLILTMLPISLFSVRARQLLRLQ